MLLMGRSEMQNCDGGRGGGGGGGGGATRKGLGVLECAYLLPALEGPITMTVVSWFLSVLSTMVPPISS